MSRGLIEAIGSQFHSHRGGRGTHSGLRFPLQLTEDNWDIGAILQI
jgi:hypothetical protein